MADEASAAATTPAHLVAQNPLTALAAQASGRFALLDAARGCALIAMILFHFTWDLDFFGLAPSGTASSAVFRYLGHAIAASFLVIVGASLALASRRGFDPRAFLRRIAVIGGSALLITAATWIVFPHEYIFFGILHCIAVASLAAVFFLRARVGVILGAAIIAVALPFVSANSAFNGPALLWLGLGTREPVTNDWAPFLPGFGFVLFGLAGARVALISSLPTPVAAWKPRRLAPRLLVRGGRRSLLVYLAHQPILLAALFVLTAIAGRSRPSEAASFVSNCSAQCVSRGAGRTYCDRACGCVAARTETTPIWSDVLENDLSPDERMKFDSITQQCLREIGPAR